MKVVLDTSAIIYLQDFRKFDEIFVPFLVMKEVKDKFSHIKLASLEAKVVEPGKASLEEVELVAKETGDLEKLSEADLQVLALAKEIGAVIVSDDYNIQNIAKKMGIKYLSVSTKGIKEVYKWKKVCPICRKEVKDELKECPVCGAKLKRRPKLTQP